MIDDFRLWICRNWLFISSSPVQKSAIINRHSSLL